MERSVLVLTFLLHVLVCQNHGQNQARLGPWRHRIQWENNGQVYSLLSTGTKYRAPAQGRRRTQHLLTTNRVQQPRRPAETRSVDSEVQNDVNQVVLGADAGQYLLVAGPPGSPASIQEFSGSGVPRGQRDTSTSAATAADFTHRMRPEGSDSGSREPAAPGWATGPEDARRSPAQNSERDAGAPQRAHPGRRVAAAADASPTAFSNNAVEIHFPRPSETSDPRDPHSIHHRNSVFYNVYPPDRRNRITVRPPPAPGHGTGFFHNGEARKV